MLWSAENWHHSLTDTPQGELLITSYDAIMSHRSWYEDIVDAEIPVMWEIEEVSRLFGSLQGNIGGLTYQ